MSIKDRSVHIDLLFTAFSSSTGKVCSPSPCFSPLYLLFPLGIKSHYCRRAISAPQSSRQIHGRPHGTLLVIIKSRLGHRSRLIYGRSVYGLTVDGLMQILSSPRLNLPWSIKSVHGWSHRWWVSYLSEFTSSSHFHLLTMIVILIDWLIFFTLSTMPVVWLIKFCTCLWLRKLQMSWPHFPLNHGEGTLCQMGNSVWHTILNYVCLIDSTNFQFKI